MNTRSNPVSSEGDSRGSALTSLPVPDRRIGEDALTA